MKMKNGKHIYFQLLEDLIQCNRKIFQKSLFELNLSIVACEPVLTQLFIEITDCYSKVD